MREQRVVTPDGHIWHVRRRWAKRRLPWMRRAAAGELAPAELDTVPVLPDSGEVLDAFGRLIHWDAEFAILAAIGLLVVGLLVLGVAVALTWTLVIPLVAVYALPIVVVLVLAGVVVLLDRLTRPWFIEAQSARLTGGPRRVWRVQGWWRARRAFKAVATAIAEGRIGAEHGIVLRADGSPLP